MRIVVDTNILVPGLLSPFGPPGVIVGLIAAGRLSLCYDLRILAECREVLHRPAFPFSHVEIMTLTAQIAAGSVLEAPVPLAKRLPDADDEPFLEVALVTRARSLVTGNGDHFPPYRRCGVHVVSPRAFIDSE